MDNGANGFSFVHQIEGFVDLLQRQAVRNERIKLNFTDHRIFNHARQLSTAFHAAKCWPAPYAPRALRASQCTALIAACVFVEGLLRLPIVRRVRLMGQTLARVRFVLSAGSVSDHWKERALLAYARKLWMDSAILLVCLLLLLIPMRLICYLVRWLKLKEFLPLIKDSSIFQLINQ